MEKQFNKIDDNLKNGIALFGAGQNGVWCLEYLLKKGYRVDCFIDNSKEIQNLYIQGIRVISLTEFMCNYTNKVILITAKHAVLPIMKLLKDYNLKMPFDAWFYYKHEKDYQNIATAFKDEKSKIVLGQIIKTMQTGDEQYCANIAEPNQYFCMPGFFNTGIETFVDLGAYTGDTVEKFIASQNGAYKQIYAFEPSKTQYNAAKVRLKRLIKEWALDKQTIHLIKAGAAGKTKNAYMELSQTLLSNHISDNSTLKNKIKVYSLDDYFKNQKISFIKVDVEGAEVDMLKGAQNIIKRDTPKFAISTYHRPDDIIEITSILKKCVPEYNFSLRHHSSFLMDTTLYCWKN